MKRFVLPLLVALFFASTWGAFRHGYAKGQTDRVARQATEPTQDARAALTVDNCMIRLNEARLAAGLPQVSEVESMQTKAQTRVEAIAADPARAYNHEGLRQSQVAGTIPADWGEIITNRPTCTEAIQSFLASPTHKDIVLSPAIQSIGIGLKDNYIEILVSTHPEQEP